MKASEMLKKAKELINSHDERYICNALDAIEYSEITNDYIVASTIKDWIKIQLDGHQSYEFWLEANHPEVYQGFYHDYSAGRLAWMDWMIAEYKKEGN
jgi:hypothetical protein